MLLIKEQYPDRKIIMILGRARNKLYRGSPTTYGQWCEKNGLAYVDMQDFRKDPNCLFTLKTDSGISKIAPKKNSKKLLKSGSKSSLKP